MKPRIVLDTNVLVSALRSRSGASFQVLSRVGLGRFDIVLSVPLVLEYESVTKRLSRSMGLTHEDIDDILDYLCRVGILRGIFYLWRPVLRDPKDDMVLEAAVEGGCGFIVTHNIDDFTGCASFGVQAIRPAGFLRILEERP
ncbi:MAG: putative toxin-antitoxin system toxin component, PIN family [Candidatus Krumholzibacteriia bacterium]